MNKNLKFCLASLSIISSIVLLTSCGNKDKAPHSSEDILSTQQSTQSNFDESELNSPQPYKNIKSKANHPVVTPESLGLSLAEGEAP